MTKPTGKRKPWTEADTIEARRLYAEHKNYAVVGKIMGRGKMCIRENLQDNRGTHARTADYAGVPDYVMAERERRMMLAPRDLTAAFFNDPLPGYSALDRIREPRPR